MICPISQDYRCLMNIEYYIITGKEQKTKYTIKLAMKINELRILYWVFGRHKL